VALWSERHKAMHARLLREPIWDVCDEFLMEFDVQYCNVFAKTLGGVRESPEQDIGEVFELASLRLANEIEWVFLSEKMNEANFVVCAKFRKYFDVIKTAPVVNCSGKSNRVERLDDLREFFQQRNMLDSRLHQLAKVRQEQLLRLTMDEALFALQRGLCRNSRRFGPMELSGSSGLNFPEKTHDGVIFRRLLTCRVNLFIPKIDFVANAVRLKLWWENPIFTGGIAVRVGGVQLTALSQAFPGDEFTFILGGPSLPVESWCSVELETGATNQSGEVAFFSIEIFYVNQGSV
jgi:hypothetical protein